MLEEYEKTEALEDQMVDSLLRHSAAEVRCGSLATFSIVVGSSYANFVSSTDRGGG